MNCRSVQNSLSAHLDGALPPGESEEVVLHLGACPQCELRSQQLTRLRNAVRKLPVACPPADLTSKLRVMASQERAKRLARSEPFGYLRDRMRLWIDNLMRPLALPFAGGLVSALGLFAVLMPGIALHRNMTINDVPIIPYTDPAVKAQTPFGFSEDDFVVEVIVDGQGRMVDYAIAHGPSLGKNPELRRTIENYLLFTNFTPATYWGAPTVGRMYLSFNRSQINVPAGKS